MGYPGHWMGAGLIAVIGTLTDVLEFFHSVHQFLRSEDRTNALHDLKVSTKSLAVAVVAVGSVFITQNYSAGLTIRLQLLCQHLEANDATSGGRAPSCQLDQRAPDVAKQLKARLDSIPNGIPGYIRNPSPEAFYFACIAFSVAIVLYFQLHRINDKLQPICLGFGLGTASLVCGVLQDSAQNLLLVYLPYAAISTLMFSARFHSIVRWVERRRQQVRKSNETGQCLHTRFDELDEISAQRSAERKNENGDCGSSRSLELPFVTDWFFEIARNKSGREWPYRP